jgi:hypothetical protein
MLTSLLPVRSKAPALLAYLLLSGLVPNGEVGRAHASTDFDLMVGFRTVVAVSISDDGYSCPDLKRLTAVNYDGEGNAIWKVTCGPLGSLTEWAHKPMRVVAYPEGDYSSAPWRDEALVRVQGRSGSPAASITQD